ncbi:hypothetical protein B9Z19DRAFT_1096677 [Tuber borchii]|uniref:Uncharacterized protein n=1 Tax=Tuber borchii TaxID=42251 RepID=A0A2T6ZBE9_TUBBO|nr:hypothetical protein B9Z19DRAFT_1096677 [Tuber borchii]
MMSNAIDQITKPGHNSIRQLILDVKELSSYYSQTHDVCENNWVRIDSQDAVHQTRTQVPLRYC